MPPRLSYKLTRFNVRKTLIRTLMRQRQLKKKSDLHLLRKIWHVTGVIAIVIIYNNVTRTSALQMISLALLTWIMVDVTRLLFPRMNKLMLPIFGPIMRDYEFNSFSGVSYLLLGTSIIIFLFPQTIVSLALLFLAFADPMASYVGIRYGKDKLIGNKSLQGTLAAFLTCTIISALYFFKLNIMTERLLIVSLLSGLVGAVSELIPLGKLDDNLSFPLVSSLLLWLLFYLFGGF